MNIKIKTEEHFIEEISNLSGNRLLMGDLNFYRFGAVDLRVGRQRPELVSTTLGTVFSSLQVSKVDTDATSYPWLRVKEEGFINAHLRLTGLVIDLLVIRPGVMVTATNCQIGEVHNLGRVVMTSCRVGHLHSSYGTSGAVRNCTVNLCNCEASAVISFHNSNVRADGLPHTGSVLLKGCTIDGTADDWFNRCLQYLGLRKQALPPNLRLTDCVLTRCRKTP